MEGVRNYVHRPWANTFKCYPELYFQPRSVEAVQEIIKYAKKKQTNLLVTGAAHSPSIIIQTSGLLMNLDKLNKVLYFTPSQSYTDVTVEAGIRLYELNDALAAQGLALQNLGSISDQSIAGVISTGTHGASCYHGLISEQIVSLDIALESGEVVTVSDTQNPELFKAVLIGLGAFGIIVRATVRAVPAFNLESRAYVVDFDKLISPETWSKVFTDAEYHRIHWYPYANKCYVWQADRTSKPEEKPLFSFYGTFLGRLLFQAFLWVAVKLKPSLTPAVEKWLFARQFDANKVTRHVGRNDHELNMDCLFKQYVTEWVIPLSNGPKALLELRDKIWEEEFYVHAPFEIRAANTTLPSTNEDEGIRVGPHYGNISRPYLDPTPELPYATPKKTTNQQLSLYLNATMFRPFGTDPAYETWFEYFERLCDRYGGKPHWAKNFKVNPWTLHEENKEKYALWKKQRDTYAPSRLFGGTEWFHNVGLL